MKRGLSLILTLIMIIGMFANIPITANAASTSNLTFKLSEDGNSYSVSECSEYASGSLTIPATYNGKSVTDIGESAFYSCDNLTSITIPDSVISIGERAFPYCTSLTTITVNSANENYCSVDGVLFNRDKTMLIRYPIGKTTTSFTIPDSVTDISVGAFESCTSLTSIIIPDSVTNIGDDAFSGCESLTSITIPDSVTSVGLHAFAYCTNLALITIPDSVTNIGSAAFYWTAFYKNDSNWDGEGLYIGNHLIATRYITENYTIKDGTKTIVDSAFYEQLDLVSIIIPDSVISIGWRAFDSCHNLKYVFCPDETFDFETKTIGEKNDCLLNAKWHYGATDHTPEKDNALAPTCTTTGKTEGSHCSVCNKIFEEQIIVPAKGHTLSDWIIDKQATCTVNGSKHTQCTVCGVTIETKTIIANGHTKVTDVAIPATCTTTGKTEGSHCSVCNTVIKAQTTVPATGHSYTSKVTTPATHTLTGVKTYTCGCGHTYTETIAKLTEHTYTAIVTKPTCTTKGYTTYTCACGDTYVSDYVNAKGHTLSDWIIDKQATCTVNGSKHTQCTVCGVTIETKTIVAPGHTKVTDAAIPATCTTAGKTEGSHCSVCNAVITAQNVVNAKGHTISDWIVYVPATVSEPGLKQKVCTVCSEILVSAIIPQLKPATPKVKAVNALNGMKVTWNAVGGAVKYGLYKRLGTDNSWTFVTTTTATSYADNNTPLAGSYYVYTVKAYNSADMASDYIKANCASVQRVVAPYTKAANTVNGINVTWGKVAGAKKYVVLRRIGTESTWKILGETTGASFLDKNVTSGIYYLYSIRAVNNTGYSEYDVNKRITIQRVLAPTAVATNLANGVQIKWTKATGATKYNVYRRVGGSSTWTLVGTTTGTSLVDKNVTNGKYYVYSIRAINGTGYSAFDTSKTDTIQPITAPTTKVAKKSNGVQLSWNKVTGATKYNVYRRLGGTNTWVYAGQTTGTSFIDTSVVKGKSYAYSIRAINGTGYSAYDSTKCAAIKHS